MRSELSRGQKLLNGLLVVTTTIGVIVAGASMFMAPLPVLFPILGAALISFSVNIYLHFFDPSGHRGVPQEPYPVSNPGPNSIRATRLKEFNNNFNIPNEMLCPITQDIMSDPVFLSDAPQAKFNRAEIELWLSRKQNNPCTRAHATIDNLRPDNELKAEINDFLTWEENRLNKAATIIQTCYRKFFDRKKNISSSDQNENTFLLKSVSVRGKKL